MLRRQLTAADERFRQPIQLAFRRHYAMG
jgi:hypothetical protein